MLAVDLLAGPEEAGPKEEVTVRLFLPLMTMTAGVGAQKIQTRP